MEEDCFGFLRKKQQHAENLATTCQLTSLDKAPPLSYISIYVEL